MHLNYLPAAPQAEVLVLRNERGWRIELFVLGNDDQSYSLLAVSGEEASRQGARVKFQGPYQIRELALAARSAIAAQLQKSGFAIESEAIACWRLQAQREIRLLRNTRKDNYPDCRFNPDDVLS